MRRYRKLVGAATADGFREALFRFAPALTPGTNGGAWVTALVNNLAIASSDERDEFTRLSESRKAEVRMCLNPPSIVMTWVGSDGRREEFEFAGSEAAAIDRPLPRRLKASRRKVTCFPMTIFVVGADLVADTWRRKDAAATH